MENSVSILVSLGKGWSSYFFLLKTRITEIHTVISSKVEFWVMEICNINKLMLRIKYCVARIQVFWFWLAPCVTLLSISVSETFVSAFYIEIFKEDYVVVYSKYIVIRVRVYSFQRPEVIEHDNFVPPNIMACFTVMAWTAKLVSSTPSAKMRGIQFITKLMVYMDIFCTYSLRKVD